MLASAILIGRIVSDIPTRISLLTQASGLGIDCLGWIVLCLECLARGIRNRNISHMIVLVSWTLGLDVKVLTSVEHPLLFSFFDVTLYIN